ncbi:nucleoside/nucleotide kinase family protein [Nesterenkonia sp. AY15]|uniref:nucleoside/nucleotide kinase family protein n=1 Tax=Nesterenkonia sp. AY15 TaxID=2901139 RepID=UPI001F4D060F|nr:nucleoside/nucleotide kinase family protein [Nesterenkonia sp. AY15]MCH8572222.1 nucleoside/nucleotide kinase family protein [Nesterenkonia sp. AY15]
MSHTDPHDNPTGPPSASTATGAFTVTDVDKLAERVLALIPQQGRILVGIAGSPGAGKTTCAIAVAARIAELLGSAETAVHLPMDGYHLANATLDRLGRRHRKGAIDTFDGWGFVALLRRLLCEPGNIVYAPSFRRDVDEGIAAEIAVSPDTRVVIVEGNYLLAEAEPWAQINELLTESWFCQTREQERFNRLVKRHERYGRSREDARAWAQSVDGLNAQLVEATRSRATLIISGSSDGENA